MITGFIPMTSGKVTVGGIDITRDPESAKRMIGYLPENAPSYPGMSVRGFLKFCAEIRGIHGSQASKAIDRVVALCFLENVIHQNVDTLSKGYRHRVCFAQSIIHDPDVLIMDEPTDGLDPNQKMEVRKIIRQMGEKKAIIFSTHILEEVEAVCSRAIIIDKGRKIEDGTPDAIKRKAINAGSILVGASGISSQDLQSHLARIPGVDKVVPVSDGAPQLMVRVFPKASSSLVLWRRRFTKQPPRDHGY
ncbi:MAG: ATP-binding cassette domain-containing protein [Verrucomicrobia bacterium]|nr:ATP-binding cassette domain-containing protein [Verrucomicrobiota bacterium]